MTRKEYLKNGKHREYYAQFVTRDCKTTILRIIGSAPLMGSTDRAFNDIPLSVWDNLPQCLDIKKLKECGDYPTLSSHVCTMKEAARQLVEDYCTPETPIVKLIRDMP